VSSTGLWFHANRGGRAKLRGRERLLVNPPALLGTQVAEIEYVPELGVYRMRDPRGGWRDMERDEIRAADQLLEQLFPPGET
jgi:hypothetical protein